MVFVLFVALSDKTLLSNFISNITSGGSSFFMSMERFVHDIVSVSRIVNTSFALTFSVGVVIAEIAIILGLSFLVWRVAKTICIKLIREDGALDHQKVNLVSYATNKIYLKTSKFIC
jgi:hypothetical protein